MWVRRWIEDQEIEQEIDLEMQYEIMRHVPVIRWLVAEGHLPEQMHQKYHAGISATELSVEFVLPAEIETYARLRWPDEF
jgi:hypothetical protein